MAKLAIRGHKERGNEVIALLEMLRGKNNPVIPYDGSDEGQYYFITEEGNINISKYAEGPVETYVGLTLEEFEKEFPYKVGDKVDCRMFGIRSVTDMYWNSLIDQILYYVKSEENECDVTIAYAKDLRPYNPEPVESSPDKAKTPSLEGQDYSEGRCGYRIPEGFELEKVEDGVILLKPKKKELPKTYKECCEVLGIDHNLYLDLNHGDISGEYKPNGYTQNAVCLFNKLYMVLICRDAYWKLADDWKPCWNGYNGDSGLKCCIFQHGATLMLGDTISRGCILMFPTEEMRDAFYENFKDLINECKELL